MSDDALIRDMAERLFAEIATPASHARHDAGEWLSDGWEEVAELGFPLALAQEERGGLGLEPVEALGLVRLAGRHALPLPLGETMLANRLLTDAGLPAAEGPATVAIGRPGSGLALTEAGSGWRLDGALDRVPWARHADAIALVLAGPDGPVVARVPRTGITIEPGQNLANEPRDRVRFAVDLPRSSVAATTTGWDPDRVHRIGAALRASAMAGALGRVLEMTVAYAGERVQFGRPIGRFQAIQQNLAVMAGHVAASSAAADLAADAVAGEAALLPIAAAKVRVGEAAGIVASIAHQVHGAIGFTREHALNQLTRRLWSWRDEFGDEAEWSLALGRAAFAAGPDGLWPMISAA